MDERIETVKKYYDAEAQTEWERLERAPFEFIFTTYMMDKHIRPGDRILDVGGGPGRYSIHYAKQGCEVTLVDLSEGNIALAREKAAEAGVKLRAIAADCLTLDSLGLGLYDHVFLMGPLYHLLDEAQRIDAVNKALACLKSGGILYASFIMAFAGVIYDMRTGGFIEGDTADPELNKLFDAVENNGIYAGRAFTSACFYDQTRIEPFMSQFGLQKLHMFGQEGILAPNVTDILSREQSEIDCWVALAKRYLEKPELLALSEHAMYVGRKR